VIRAVLVVVTRQIGDVLLTTPLIHAAKELWPDAAVDVLGFQGTMGMLRGNPDVREIIETPARPGFGGTLALARRLWKRYDVALIADVGDRAHIIGAVAARERAGIVPPHNPSNWWKKRLLAHVVQSAGDLGDVHVVQEKLALLAPWGAGRVLVPRVIPPEGKPLDPGLRRDDNALDDHSLSFRRTPESSGFDRYIVVHAPSMWTYKQWPPEHFAELIRLLTQAGHRIVLTGGPSQQDRELVSSLATDAAVDAGVLDFGQLATLIQGAALYIGPDTSISHLAAACGTPVVAIFGPTNPQRWAPWPSQSEAPVRFMRRADSQATGNVTILQSDLPCVPCAKAGCDDHRSSRADCLPAITPDRVAHEALRLLSARG
jgi:heptosyltransferase-3